MIKKIALIFIVFMLILFLINYIGYKKPIGKQLDELSPTLSLDVPSIVYESKFLLKGIASDNMGVREVKVKLDNDNWEKASGTNSWTKTLNLKPGLNTIYIQAFDTSNNASPVLTNEIIYQT